MEDRKNIRPLTQSEKDFATEKYHLITDFLKRQRLDAEEFYDVVVFDFLLAVESSEIILNKSPSFSTVTPVISVKTL